jgi:hypothetical protein
MAGRQRPIDTTDAGYTEAWAMAVRYLDMVRSEGCDGRVRVEPITKSNRHGGVYTAGHAIYLTLTSVPEGAAERLAQRLNQKQ